MTSHLLLNIGLMAKDVEIAETTVYKTLRGAGILWERVERFESSTEPTLVVECYANDHQVHLVSTWLEQDCIAVWDMIHWEGRLVGPNKQAWGEFDPSQFLLLSGCKLSEVRSAA